MPGRAPNRPTVTWSESEEGETYVILHREPHPPRTVSKPVRDAATQLIEKLRKERDSLPSGI